MAQYCDQSFNSSLFHNIYRSLDVQVHVVWEHSHTAISLALPLSIGSESSHDLTNQRNKLVTSTAAGGDAVRAKD